jgi:hypothetical protein
MGMSKLRHGLMTMTGLLLLAAGSSAFAEKKSLKAVMPWEGDGKVYQIGPETMLFLGAFEGIIYVETSEGKLDEGFVRCPGSQTIDVKTGKTSGEGHCMITPSAGDIVYATWSCKGEVGGCKGDFKLTGGSGQYKGISGSSKLLVRSAINTLVVGLSSGSVVREATGIAILPELTYSIPGSK